MQRLAAELAIDSYERMLAHLLLLDWCMRHLLPSDLIRANSR